ncbi:MAG: metallophosphatase [Prevotella sp.]|nr:metallophosphatase [Prevotella sp.]
MRRNIIITLMWVALAVAAQAQDKKLVILHTNDTHSCIMPLNENLADKNVAGRGGFIRRLELLKDQRREDPDLLYFDSGDFSQGSPYYTMFKGDVEVGLMNRMGIDAATIGNHEFDFGLENMARIFKMATFPIVCANYDFTGTPVEGLVKPYVIIKRKGVKIGVFGLAPQLDGLVSKQTCEGVRYLDPVAKALEVATFLKEKKKCDLVICISHLGWKMDVTDDLAAIAGSRNIDLVLGGHSHTYLEELEYVKNLDGKDVPVDQNGKHGVWIGKLTVDLKKK